MIYWTDEALTAAEKAFWGDHHQIEKADMKAALVAAAYEQMRTTGEISISCGMAGFYDAGFDRAIEDCARRIEHWEIDVDMHPSIRGRLPDIIRDLKKGKP